MPAKCPTKTLNMTRTMMPTIQIQMTVSVEVVAALVVEAYTAKVSESVAARRSR